MHIDAKGKTVKDLIAVLRFHLRNGGDPEAIVSLEGCDCYGDWNGRMQFSTPGPRDKHGSILLCR